MKSFILHLDSLSILDEMNDEQAGQLIKAIYHFQEKGELPELDFGIKMAIAPFINQFSRDKKKYNSIVKRNRENGKKGGRKPKDTQENPVGYLGTQTIPKNLKSKSKNKNNSNNKEHKEKIYKKESLNEFNPETSLHRMDIRNALSEAMGYWPIVRRADLNECYDKVWANYKVDCETASLVKEAAKTYSDYLKQSNTDKKYYPNFKKWLGVWENYKGLTVEQITEMHTEESESDRFYREYDGPLKG